MIPYGHQIEIADEAYSKLAKYGLVYLSMLERTGKTLTSILVCEYSKADKILVVTKKKAIEGWDETLDAFEHEKSYTIINYESLHKVKGNFDLVIIDEAHKVAAYPKPGKAWKMLYKFTIGKPIIYLSATPFAENVGQLYNQFRLSSWSPFKQYKNFYEFFRIYGESHKTRTPYGLVETYSKYKSDIVLKLCEHLFIAKTRVELGFEHEPEDVVHNYNQSDILDKVVKSCVKTELLKLPNEVVPLDSPMKLRTTIYQLEGGWARVEGKCFMSKLDRVKAIQKDWGEGEDCAIMAHFICEQENLQQYFPKAKIYSSNKFAEGISLAHIENLIIYSMDFSTARFTQRRARQANMKRATPINVHFYFAKGSMSEEVYKSVAKKHENFNKNSYERWRQDVEAK